MVTELAGASSIDRPTAQLHALTQLPFDRKPLLPLVLSGQNILIDRLLFHTLRPFASRVIAPYAA